VQGTWWYDTTNDLLKWYDGSAWIVVLRVSEAGDCAAPIQGEVAFADADATPSVKGIMSAITANTGATTITGFDDGTAGQVLTLRIYDANTTIGSGLTATGMQILGVSGDTLQWVYDGAAWKQIGGSVGMGRYVPVSPSNAIGDANLAPATAAAADVDVSDDGVRKGAAAVHVVFVVYNNSGTTRTCYGRANGGSTTGNQVAIFRAHNGLTGIYCAKIPLDANAIWEYWAAADWSGGSSTLEGYVHGYWI
jgi:hypothetical protein